MLDTLEDMRNTAIFGDNGSGKTLVLQSVAEKLRNSDKDIVYINALDHSFEGREDILDGIMKLRSESGVTVLDIGILRKQYLETYQGIFQK